MSIQHKCDLCTRIATHRLIMIDPMKCKIGDRRAYLMCRAHAAGVWYNYYIEKINKETNNVKHT